MRSLPAHGGREGSSSHKTMCKKTVSCLYTDLLLLLQDHPPPHTHTHTHTHAPLPQPPTIPQQEREENLCLLSLLEPMHPMVYSQRLWTQVWKCGNPDAAHSPSSSSDSLFLWASFSGSAVLSLFFLSLLRLLDHSLPHPPSLPLSLFSAVS